MIDIDIEWEKIEYEGDTYVLLSDVEATIAELVLEARKEFKRLKECVNTTSTEDA